MNNDSQESVKAIGKRIPDGLMASAKARSEQVVEKIKAAKATIEDEIEANDGIYPYNAGRVTQAEVCRRAGVKNVTLQGKIHKTTTKVELDRWLAELHVKVVRGSRNVRRKINEKIDSWKEAHRQIANAYHLDSILFAKSRARIVELEQENDALRAQLASSGERKVIGLIAKKGS